MIPYKIDMICRLLVYSFPSEVDVVEISSSAEHNKEKNIYGKSICRMPTYHIILMNFSHLYRNNVFVVIRSQRKVMMASITDIFYSQHGQGGPFTPFTMSFNLF